MNEEKIVSIEDRIPKLKQARKKKANRRLIFYLSIFFILIAVIVYLQSPLSHVRSFDVTGNSFLTDEEVLDLAGLAAETNIWTLDKDAVTSSVLENPIIQEVEVDRQLPWTVQIKLMEHERVGYKEEENHFYPVLGNGTVLTEMAQNTYNGDAPLLAGFSDEELFKQMTAQLQAMPESILGLISEIHWRPSDGDNHSIMLYMNDGYMVSGTIREFAEKMQVYPSIVSQLEPGSEGIIHIGVGAYFEAFGSAEETADSENESDAEEDSAQDE